MEAASSTTVAAIKLVHSWRPSKHMPPTVLVTGATGYIASELVAQLLDKGYTVVAAARNLEKAAFLSQLPGAQERLRVVRCRLDPCARSCKRALSSSVRAASSRRGRRSKSEV